MVGAPSIYRRVVLKLSGEALSGSTGTGIDPKVLMRISEDISQVKDLGVQLGIVIGGGNLFRGATLSKLGLDRVTGDHMGMLATLMNALAFRDVFERVGLSSRIMSAIPMSGIVDHYDRRKAIHHLQEGRIVIFAAGTGTPLVTTDSAASLRAIEINADVVCKATNVDGVYSSDPHIDTHAVKYDHMSYQAVVEQELGIMDLAAFCQCRDHGLPIRVFNINKPGSLVRVLRGHTEGTLIDNQELA